MKKYGVIFDFNGTLFWDSEYQERSWDEYLDNYGISLSATQKREYIHGRNGKDTFEILFKRKLSKEEVHKYTEEKEVLYRKESLKHKMELAPGAKSLLQELKEKGIPMAIATASGKSNVDFFIEKFRLLDYFCMENIIYNDGTVKGKPHPEIFLKTMERLGIERSKTTIFEDSYSGIQAAINSKASRVVIVNSNGENYSKFGLPIIKHFNEFDRKFLDQ